MFYLSKRDDIWTLSYEVGPLRRVLLIGAGVAGLLVAAFVSVKAGPFDRSSMSVMGGVVVALAAMAYWTLSDAGSSVMFDLQQRRVTVLCNRPWFGPPRSYAFSAVASLHAVSRSGETTDSWEAVLELHNGSRIRLGREPEGANARIRGYLDELRKVSGIAEL